MKFTDKLNSLNACSEAVEWVGHRGLVKAWKECPRGDWMLWLAGRLDVDRQLIVLAACDCAETALRYVPECESGPADCIRTVRNWCNGTASIDDVRAGLRGAALYAALYASAPATAVASAHAASAADAAASAAITATLYAAYAATEAASAHAASVAVIAAREKALKICAELVRKRIPVSIIQEALLGLGAKEVQG